MGTASCSALHNHRDHLSGHSDKKKETSCLDISIYDHCSHLLIALGLEIITTLDSRAWPLFSWQYKEEKVEFSVAMDMSNLLKNIFWFVL